MDVEERIAELEARIGAHQDAFILMMRTLERGGIDLREMLSEMRMLERFARKRNLRSGAISELQFLADQLQSLLEPAASPEPRRREDQSDE